MNRAHLANDCLGMDLSSLPLSLCLPGFRKEIELRFAGAILHEYVAADNVDQSFQLHLVADDFGHVLAKVSELLLSGVVAHCSLNLSLPTIFFTDRSASGVEHRPVVVMEDQRQESAKFGYGRTRRDDSLIILANQAIFSGFSGNAPRTPPHPSDKSQRACPARDPPRKSQIA